MSGRASLGADDGECRNFHRFARAPPATCRHAGHIIPNYDTAGHTLTSQLCRVPAVPACQTRDSALPSAANRPGVVPSG